MQNITKKNSGRPNSIVSVKAGTNPGTRRRLGTTMRGFSSHADHFSLIMHGLEGEGDAQEALLEKEGVHVCGTHRCVPV